MRTRRRRLVVATAAVLIAGITLAACGDDSDGGGDASDNAITITASEYAFAIDGEATGGYVQVNFQNDGEEPHILVPFKLQDGKTSADALPLLSSEEEPDPEALAEVFDGDPFTSFWGTPGLLAAGDAQTTVANFPTGSYALVCFLPAPDGQPHVALGMVADLTVGEGDTPAPEAEGTIDITADGFTVPDGVQSGTYAVTNGGRGSVRLQHGGPDRGFDRRLRRGDRRVLRIDRHRRDRAARVPRPARRRLQRDDAARRDGLHRHRPRIGPLLVGGQQRR